MGNALQNDPQGVNKPNNNGKAQLNKSPDALVKMLGNTFLTNDGSGDKTFRNGIAPNKIIGLYFSAHWCGPCRQFTPFLKQVHDEWKKSGSKIEIVFVSGDRSYEQFKQYFNNEHGNWLAIPFGTNIIQNLNSTFQVRGIPCLIFLDGCGNIIERNGRNLISQQRSNAYNVLLNNMPKIDKFEAFGGVGHSLKSSNNSNNNNDGTTTGNGEKTIYDEIEGKAATVNKNEKSAKMQVVFVGGKKEMVEMNSQSHTVKDLYCHVKHLNDCGKFELLAGFPPKALKDGKVTIEDAKLSGARITQKKL